MAADVADVVRLKKDGRIDEAIQLVQALLTEDGSSAEGHYLYAQLLIAKGDMNQASRELLTATYLNPKHSGAFNDLGCICVWQKDYQRALDNILRAIKINPSNYQALKNLIQFLLQMKAEGQDFEPAVVINDLFREGIWDIGADRLPGSAKRVLVVYVSEAIPWYVGDMLDHFGYISKHSMFWETCEMVRLFNEYGYVVDYVGIGKDNLWDKIDHRRYRIIVDGEEGKNIAQLPPCEGQTRVRYSTGQHWLRANLAELNRLSMFHKRHGIVMPAERQQKSTICDDHADYLTYFGNPSQLVGYGKACRKIPLNISAAHLPLLRERNINSAKSHFIWLGGHAMIHKGLDLVAEAFSRMPDATLHIAAYLEIEPQFFSWLKTIMQRSPNIIYHGWSDVASPEFERLAWDCLGTVYVSAAEGGPGSVAQLLHFGIIPIVTRSSNVRAEMLCYVIDAEKDTEIIADIERYVRRIMDSPNDELRTRSRQIREFALATHARAAYSKSFRDVILQIMAEERLGQIVGGEAAVSG